MSALKKPDSHQSEHDLRQQHVDHGKTAPGEISIGVIIGRASEYLDFFVFSTACILVFSPVFFHLRIS